MSYPGLHLHIASIITADEVADFLNVKITPKNIGRGIFGGAQVGGVTIDFRLPWWDESFDLGNSSPWVLALHLKVNSRDWTEMQTQLALTICNFFYRKSGGYYFAAYDVGSPLFVVGEDGLLVSDIEHEYYSKYPFPFEKFSFRKLPFI